MKKFAISVATAATLAVTALGMAGPALAAPSDASYQAVDCSVHVNSGGTDVGVNWC
ncbi:hypothetical protein [Mycobacterium sp. ACS1612]|uniref:hypothetical protein n=1 Tax=Mycobacterium sp. ACS1612 TaxID=1834117 RepID=UPI000A4C3A43|nr:hypothetical protein [Mycobacterium sp. ACS1612]